MVDPPVDFKTIEGHTLAANADLGKVGPDLKIEAVAVHAEVPWRVTETEQARDDRVWFVHRGRPLQTTVSGPGIRR